MQYSTENYLLNAVLKDEQQYDSRRSSSIHMPAWRGHSRHGPSHGPVMPSVILPDMSSYTMPHQGNAAVSSGQVQNPGEPAVVGLRCSPSAGSLNMLTSCADRLNAISQAQLMQPAVLGAPPQYKARAASGNSWPSDCEPEASSLCTSPAYSQAGRKRYRMPSDEFYIAEGARPLVSQQIAPVPFAPGNAGGWQSRPPALPSHVSASKSEGMPSHQQRAESHVAPGWLPPWYVAAQQQLHHHHHHRHQSPQPQQQSQSWPAQPRAGPMWQPLPSMPGAHFSAPHAYPASAAAPQPHGGMRTPDPAMEHAGSAAVASSYPAPALPSIDAVLSCISTSAAMPAISAGL